MLKTWGWLLLLAASSFTATAADGAADAAFARQFGDQFLDGYWRENPESGIANGYYRHADRLLVPDAGYRAHYRRYLEQTLARLAAIDPKQLSEGPRADWAILKNRLESERWGLSRFKQWQWDPSLYNVAEPFALLLNTPYAPEPQRLRTVMRRLGRVPAYYAAARAAISRPTREHTQLAIQQSAGVLEVLGRGLEVQLAGSGLSAAERTEFWARLRPARAAVQSYIDWLKALDAQLALDSSARDFRIGEALYEQKFAYDIQSGSSGKQLYERALVEKERLHARMAVLADQLWPNYFPDRAPPADRVARIGSLIARLAERHSSREGFVDEVKRQIPQLEAWVREHDLLSLDASRPLQVRETPAYQRGLSIASVNAPGPYDPTANTYYNVAPLDDYTPEQAESFLREYNHWQLQVLNIHEAVPGHYVQLLHANKSPSRIKTLFGNGAMVEGWAVYAEKMMLESGWGGREPELELLHGKWLLRVVSNTIIDYGIQVLGWSEQQVLDLIRNEAFQSETEARGKWRRATLSQVQLTSYFAGYSAIYDYRERLKAELGPRFDLKRFHERFLSFGSAPVAVIESLMRPQDAAKP
ncbi:MAG: DUF885 domain-containing protein [Stagnimonas sp.]|nr:DUF885 domain-containing protein [Stagnimonas sp.]